MVGILQVVLNLLLNVLEYAIFIEVILSWVYRGNGNAFTNILHSFTEPIMIPARKLHDKLLPGGSMMDFSPIIALVLISALRYVINLLL